MTRNYVVQKGNCDESPGLLLVGSCCNMFCCQQVVYQRCRGFCVSQVHRAVGQFQRNPPVSCSQAPPGLRFQGKTWNFEPKFYSLHSRMGNKFYDVSQLYVHSAHSLLPPPSNLKDFSWQVVQAKQIYKSTSKLCAQEKLAASWRAQLKNKLSKSRYFPCGLGISFHTAERGRSITTQRKTINFTTSWQVVFLTATVISNCTCQVAENKHFVILLFRHL